MRPSPQAEPAPVAAPPAAIRLAGVRKEYRLGARTVAALRGVDLTIPCGGHAAIMGPSGSGKSTLLQLVAGLDWPDEGTVEVAGAAIHRMRESDLVRYRRTGVGVIFQQFNLLPALDALANVCLPGVLDGRDSKWTRERALSLLEELGVADRAHHRPDALSGGEQQRVAIARALLFEPPVLLADEPTGSLDSQSGARLFDLLGELTARRGSTLLLVTHEPLAASRCDTIHVLRDGAVAGSFNTDGMDPSDLAERAARLGRA